jgi:anti-anti-sigma factor
MNSNLNREEKTLTLRLSGDLISTTVETVRNEAGDLFGTEAGASPKWDTFILDLTMAQMVDSAGLNFVVSLLKRIHARGAKMQVKYSSPNIFRTFMFTRLDKRVALVKV